MRLINHKLQFQFSHIAILIPFLLSFQNALGQNTPVTFSSNLPVLVIETGGKRIRDTVRMTAWMGVVDNGSRARNTSSDSYNNYDGQISIEIRGNSSQEFPKKSYAFETQTETGENNNVTLLGMPRENDWILHGPYSDKSLMRNVLTFKLARDMGRWAPRTRYCELYINDDYRGIYVLMEKIKRDNDRVDIAKLNPDDISGDALTGGYILKLDWEDPKSEGWESPIDGSLFHYHHPQKADLQPEQRSYIRDFITEFEYVLDGHLYLDPVQGYRKYLDLPSFIDYFISVETAHNADSYSLSTFMYKDQDSRDSTLHMGPLWDFNLAYGNQDEGSYGTPYRWSWKYPLDPNSFWWERFFTDSVFVDQLMQRYSDLRENILDEDQIINYIDAVADTLDEAQERNYQRWPVLGEWVWPNAYVGETYHDEVDYLKDFMYERLEWVDENTGDVRIAISEPDTTQPKPEPEKKHEIRIYPNPIRSATQFQFEITYPGHVHITIYNLLGQRVITLVNGQHGSGITHVSWDKRDSRGVPVASGVYLYIFRVNWEVCAKRKILVL